MKAYGEVDVYIHVFLTFALIESDRPCGLVAKVPGYTSRGPGFDSRALQEKK
jgi:hypothetical protein